MGIIVEASFQYISEGFYLFLLQLLIERLISILFFFLASFIVSDYILEFFFLISAIFERYYK